MAGGLGMECYFGTPAGLRLNYVNDKENRNLMRRFHLPHRKVMRVLRREKPPQSILTARLEKRSPQHAADYPSISAVTSNGCVAPFTLQM
jgi:hypothetical protein